MQEVLHGKCYMKTNRKYLVQTRSQTNTSGVVLLKEHGIEKGLDPNMRSDKQVIKPHNVPIQ